MYLTYGQHGEERERSRALLELKRLYTEAGFELASSELPDYLPLMLEFVSHAGWKDAVNVLGPYHEALSAIHQELLKLEDPYSSLFELLLSNFASVDKELAAGPLPEGRGAE
jgi:nitrate reductase delta subunit